MSKEKPFLVLDYTWRGKAVGLAWAGSAGASAGGLTIQGGNLAFKFIGLANPEITALGLGLMVMAYAADRTAELLSNDIAERHGLEIREMAPPRWDIERLKIF
ncbi:MAG: hypothetical protein EBQ96_06150 [Proteobacteria bacterium]|nr:hypothetical protein [Pseudomonadota bacterium]